MIIVDILTRLPVKTLLLFRCVCKPWCKLTKDPYFVKKHLKCAKENDDLKFMVVDGDGLYSMDFDEVSFAQLVNMDHPFNSSKNYALNFDYCNGLFIITILVECRNELIACLWNPSTKEYKELPAISYNIPDGSEYCHSEYYIWYDYNIEDYKVVRIVCYKLNGSFGTEVKVYTLGSNSWRSIEVIPYYSAYVRVASRMFVNGALHWIIGRLIVSLDIGDEKCRMVPLPNSLDKEFDQMTLGLLEWCLCILCRYGKQRADVWLMKDYGIIESWTKLLTIGRKSSVNLLTIVDKLEAPVDYTYFRPVDIFKNGEILLHHAGMENRIPLILYDPKHERVRSPWSCFNRCRTVKSYVGSLVALNSGTYVEEREDEEAELNYLYETALNKLYTGNPEEHAEAREMLRWIRANSS